MHKANIVAFIKTIFLRPVLTLANTPFTFFAFFPLFPLQIFLLLLFLDSWGVYATLRKILDTLDEKPQRNNLSKLGTLKCECPQLWHSAMANQQLNYQRSKRFHRYSSRYKKSQEAELTSWARRYCKTGPKVVECFHHLSNWSSLSWWDLMRRRWRNIWSKKVNFRIWIGSTLLEWI